jgi:hypothetical protein
MAPVRVDNGAMDVSEIVTIIYVPILLSMMSALLWARLNRIEEVLATKADKNDLATKADKNDLERIVSALETKADKSDVERVLDQVSHKADKSDVLTKADKSDVVTKADKSDVERLVAVLGAKADKSDVESVSSDIGALRADMTQIALAVGARFPREQGTA